MKRTEKLQEDICTNISCKGKLVTRIVTTNVPAAVFVCRSFAESWIDHQPKEEGVSYFLFYGGIDYEPKIED